MSYQVLARKWRPRQFADLVGQEHVVRALVNGLDRNRLHHAFLFTGTRGVGKTTIARILAKSLNCEGGVTSQPCGTCRACTEVDEGRFVDLIEVDAASRTKVDDTRELLENVQYAPTRGRFKVYLIDEVHMLSTHSFNALLKTLEEPPPHVKFLLATTDPQKLPVTVLSRCLQFSLKRLQPPQIEAQLRHILAAEGVAYDTPALTLLAHAADGSMRDALSLVDQAIAYCGGKVSEREVRDMLGTIDNAVVDRLLAALAAGDAHAVLAAVADASEHSIDYDGLLQELMRALHRIALAQIAPQALDADAPDTASLFVHARGMTPEDVQLYYQIGLIGRRDLDLAPDARGGLEMALLRMLAFRPAVTPVAGPDVVREDGPRPEAGIAAARAVPEAPVSHQVAAPAPTPASGSWSDTVAQLRLAGLMRELASHTTLDSSTDNMYCLTLDQSMGHLLNKEREGALREALAELLGRPVTLRVQVGVPAVETPAQVRIRASDERQQAAARAIEDDPNVRALEQTFNARVSPGSVRSKL
ncbi:MAG: DNA polymerase III subunit gamma/tau [Gammaproteobacteria bacterium]|nr:DNA polymerase III subunit gamma/tau [Gammaproteobacteria bacterium]